MKVSKLQTCWSWNNILEWNSFSMFTDFSYNFIDTIYAIKQRKKEFYLRSEKWRMDSGFTSFMEESI